MRVETTCIYCGVGCRLNLRVSDGKIVGVLSSNNGPGQGRLCIKGWSAHEFIHHPDRVTKPLIKKNGKFVESSWEEALDLVADKIRETKEKQGPHSIGFLSSAKATNEENYLFQKLARAVIGTNNVDHCARLCHSSTVSGLVSAFGSGAMTNSQEDVEEADVIFVIGSNTTEQHPLIARRIIRAVKSGATLIVADPRAIELTEYAEVYLDHLPGSDVALLNAMMNVIIEEGLEDIEFITQRTEGFDDIKETITKYNPEYTEPITGVTAKAIRKAARIYGKAEKAAIFFSMGITQHTTGVDNVVSVANLAMLTGNIGKPGTGVNPLRGQNNVQGACDMGALPNYLPGYITLDRAEQVKKVEEVWGKSLSKTDGLASTEMMNICGEKIKALIIMGENPLLSDPDVNHVKKQLQKLDFLAVSDLFITETAQYADVILPACSFTEKDGTFTATDRRVQLVRKAIEPLGDSMPDWMIISEIATRLGYEMCYSKPSEIMHEITKVAPIYNGITHHRLEEEDLRWPCTSSTHEGTRILHKDRFSRGKGLFQSIEYRPPAETPDQNYPYILTTGRKLFHWHTGTMTRRSETLTDQLNEAYVEINNTDANNLGITSDDIVQVSSRRGDIRLKAEATDRIKQGVVFIPFHFAEAAANKLTNNALDPIAKIPEFKVCAVKIEKID